MLQETNSIIVCPFFAVGYNRTNMLAVLIWPYRSGMEYIYEALFGRQSTPTHTQEKLASEPRRPKQQEIIIRYWDMLPTTTAYTSVSLWDNDSNGRD